jgi:integrase
MRTTYCFRHKYATFRLQMGVDVYFLAQQMGMSVQMIEIHYGHVNTVKHADRVLMGTEGWDQVVATPTEVLTEPNAKAAQAIKSKQPEQPHRPKR